MVLPMQLRWSVPLGLGALLCLVVAGCRQTTDAEDLDGHVFLLVSADGFTPATGTTVRLSFDGRHFGLHAGCNHVDGAFSIDGDELVIGSFAMTEIGCPPPLQDQDQFLLEFLMSRPKLRLDDDQLTLLSERARLIFLDREVADPDRELAGTLWTIDTFINGDAASNIPLPSSPTILFDAAGVVSVDTTCHSGTGGFEVAGDSIVLSGMVYTEEQCPAGQTTADGFIRELMRDGEVSFEIEGPRLTLMRGGNGLGALDASSDQAVREP